MEIHENEVQDILGVASPAGGASSTERQLAVWQPGTITGGIQPPFPSEASLVNELVETKQRIERMTKEMEGMKDEITTLRRANPKPAKIFALGFIPSAVLAKSNVEMLKWVSDVLSISMKKRMEGHRDHFKIIETVSGVGSIGVRTCPVYNRIERCSLKWHQMIKTTRTGHQRNELRIHCCTLCLEALGIICGHPLLKCPWIFEDTWKKLPVNTEN